MHKIFDDFKEHASYSDICEIKEKLMGALKMEINEKGVSQMNTEEAGQVVDMIKDLAEAEKCCMEACYYKTVIKAMKEGEDDGWEDRMGYDDRRYDSGRFAPKKKGRRELYDEMDRKYPAWENMRMGYPIDDRMKRVHDEDWDDEYGRPYNEYRKAKKYYTETKSMAEKQRMDEHANKHLHETIGTFREIWKDADPNMKKKMKTDLTTLINEMNV